MVDTTRPLAARHELFATRYANHGNASLAAREAGYSDRSTAYRLLKKPRIAQRVDELQREAIAATQIDLDRVVAEWARVGFANMADYVGRDGTLNIRTLTRDKAAAVVEYTETTSAAGVVTRRIKLANKLDALEKLGRHLGAYEADNSQQALAGGAINPRDLARRVIYLLREAEESGQIAALPALVDVTPDSH